jgi:hypothetical protein
VNEASPSPPAPPPDAKYAWWLTAIKGLTVSNVLVIALLALIVVPVYVIYRALGDDALLDRLLSTYEELSSQQSGCAVRHVQERGGPEMWGVSSGFAFQGADRWFVNVVLTHEPTAEEVYSYCESLKLIADRMLLRDSSGGREFHGGPVPGAQTNGSGHTGNMPATEGEGR